MSAEEQNVIPFPAKPMEQPMGLPPPRIWDDKKLAAFLGVKVSWVRRRARPNAPDPIPRLRMKAYRFDTWSPEFVDWMARLLGYKR